MKHHLYQIYYGGWKIKLTKQYYCKDCDLFIDENPVKISYNETRQKLLDDYNYKHHHTTENQSGNP